MSTTELPIAQNGKPLTVKDVARLSGTSPSTVSRVLTGRVPVAPEKREAVLKAIADLGYRPNLLARSLKTKATHTLGLLINDILNPFYGGLARGVEDEANARGYAVLLCNTNESAEKERSYLRMLQDKAVDGIVLAPTGGNKAAIEELIASGTAVVQIDRRLPGLAASSVTLDNEAGGRAAVDLLLAQGHTRIGFVTYAMGQLSVAGREAGYREALRAAGIADRDDFICRVKFDLGDTTRLLSRLLLGEDPPEALVAANNRITLAVLAAIRELGLSVPNDVALVVFDDLEIFGLSTPSLTAIAQPAYAMGGKAAEFLLQELGSDGPAVTHSAVFQPELIVRESSRRIR